MMSVLALVAIGIISQTLSGPVESKAQTTMAQNNKTSFDASTYIQSRELETSGAQNSAVLESDVTIKGIRYRAFDSSAGTLFVPRVNNITKGDIERGLCANQIPKFLETSHQEIGLVPSGTAIA